MKNIIITGAADGIGFYLVKQLLSQHYNVTVLDLETGSLSGLRKEYDSLLPMVCDVRDFKQMELCVRESMAASTARSTMPACARSGAWSRPRRRRTGT